jgi:hypothetical protein
MYLSECRGRGDESLVEVAAPMRRRSRRRLRERAEACRGRWARAVDGNPREYPASSGRVGRAASDFVYKAGFRGKRDRQKLAQKLAVWPRLQLLAARIGPESQPNRGIVSPKNILCVPLNIGCCLSSSSCFYYLNYE